jgi:hypothetical protein
LAYDNARGAEALPDTAADAVWPLLTEGVRACAVEVLAVVVFACGAEEDAAMLVIRLSVML